MTRNVTKTTLCSTLAIATAMVMIPHRASAQAFQGSGAFANGAGSINTTTTTTDITINSSQAVIDWAPSDTAVGNFGAIGFQYSGTTATFSGASDFAVLNRINAADTSRAIFMDGTINSLVNGQTGGSIFFYSPSGLIVGQNAVINVGSLGLTSSPIAVDGNGNFLNGTTVTFGNSLPGKQVVTVNGSQINALNPGSYVAMVAPRVEHHGAITVNGAAALVGAEAATINFRVGGLFDIQVDSGTTDATGVFSDGSITGNASSGTSDLRRIYMVAVPKNSLLTMAIQQGSNLGFDIAQAANVYGNAVVLSAGHNISYGSASSDPSAASGANAGININNANFSSAVYGRANGTIYAGGNNNGSASFASDLSLRARDIVRLSAGFGGSTTVGGNVRLSADASSNVTGAAATAGGVELFALDGSTLSIAGSADLSAIGRGGGSSTVGVTSGDGTGGTIVASAWNGSTISIGGALYANANGYGGYMGSTGVDGGTGTGGAVTVQATLGNASINTGGAAFLSADGEAGNGGECFSCGGVGGIGRGGSVYVGGSGVGDSVTFANALSMAANGYGGIGQTGAGGSGLGGFATIDANSGMTVTVSGQASLEATGTGGTVTGAVGNGGGGTGGTSRITSSNGSTVGFGNFLSADASGYGGGASLNSATAGDGRGGTINVSVSASNLTGATSNNFRADGFGGFTGGNCSTCGGVGGSGFGGSAAIHVYGPSASTVTLGASTVVSAVGLGRGGGIGAGIGPGGTAVVSTDAGTMTGGDVWLNAYGNGGSADVGNGGVGLGGVATFQEGDATVNLSGVLTLNVSATGGLSNSGNGGAATGGQGNVYLFGAPSMLTVSGLTTLDSRAFGGTGYSGTGGNATGGFSQIYSGSGVGHFVGDVNLYSTASGGGGSSSGGNALGGTALLQVINASAALTFDGAATINANATGGSGGSGNGGNATGGNADIFIHAAGSTLTVGGATTLSSDAASGFSSSGNGGTAAGGLSQIFSSGGTGQFNGNAIVRASCV